MSVDRTVPELEAISVRYFLAQCLTWSLPGAKGDKLLIVGSSVVVENVVGLKSSLRLKYLSVGMRFDTIDKLAFVPGAALHRKLPNSTQRNSLLILTGNDKCYTD